MAPTDFLELLDSPADLAVFSTYQFDPEFFERRVLRTKALEEARRILVFVDAKVWQEVLGKELPARGVNRHYLVVPVTTSNGVFHPKLSLMAKADGGKIICGSNNLTRAGCSSNIELMNALSFSTEEPDDSSIHAAREAWDFFLTCCDFAEEQAGKIAKNWLEEFKAETEWLRGEVPKNKHLPIQLIHTYSESIWDKLKESLERDLPTEILVVSPFYDREMAIGKRIRQEFGSANIEIVVQQETCNLPIESFKALGKKASLSVMKNQKRRLHAKMVAWKGKQRAGYLVGSANFTWSAFYGANVEACFLVRTESPELPRIFVGEYAKAPCRIEDFKAGDEAEPLADPNELAPLVIKSAVLDEQGDIRVKFLLRLDEVTDPLRLILKVPGNSKPIFSKTLTIKADENYTRIRLTDGCLSQIQGPLFAILEAGVSKSVPVWVIQESKLTHEGGSSVRMDPRETIEESGEGLLEALDDIGLKNGTAAVIEYLGRLNIRFHDGSTRIGSYRKFRLDIRDPFLDDSIPDWLLRVPTGKASLADAIEEFVERHEHQRLARHCRKGNLNGLANFRDIVVTLVQLLVVNYRRGVLKSGIVIKHLTEIIEYAVGSIQEDEIETGFLHAIFDNYDNVEEVQAACDECEFLANIWAVFTILQKTRFESGANPKPERFGLAYPFYRKRLKDSVDELGLKKPSKQNVLAAIQKLGLFLPEQIEEFKVELSS